MKTIRSNMKRNVILLTLLLALGFTLPTDASLNVTIQTEQTDTAAADELEAFSDTTSAAADAYDSTVVSQSHRIRGIVNSGANGVMKDIFENIGIEGFSGMVFVLLILAIIFVVAPVLILAVVLFFVYKNRKQKIRMAEMAMQQGQPIPDQLLEEHRESDDQLWQTGLRQTFLGVGLLAFFGYVGSTLGIGVGILVTVIGLGKLAIVKTTKRN
jgi:hypothetical protein